MEIQQDPIQGQAFQDSPTRSDLNEKEQGNIEPDSDFHLPDNCDIDDRLIDVTKIELEHVHNTHT